MGFLRLTASQPTTNRSLRQNAAGGIAWMLGNSLASKLCALLGQMTLAWLLTPRDFGVVAMAYSVQTFISVLENAGIAEVLIHRQKSLARWATPACWMAIALGVASMLATFVAAPLAARAFHEPGVIPIMVILAVNAPIAATTIVPRAALQSRGQFGILARISILQTVIVTALSIFFASPLVGLGALSVVAPLPFANLIQSIFLWWGSDARVQWHPRLNRWKWLWRDSGLLLATAVVSCLVSQGDYLILGMLGDPVDVGLYFFAFRLSLQTMLLLMSNVNGITLPLLSRLQDDPTRQQAAYKSATSLLAAVAVPACVMQAALAQPLFELLFAPRWLPAVPLMQILSFGIASRSIDLTTVKYIRAQGRFMAGLALALGSAIAFLLAGLIGFGIAGVTGLAVAFAASYAVATAGTCAVALRSIQQGTIHFVNCLGRPVLLSMLTIGGGWLVARNHGGLWTAWLAPFVGALVYLLAMRSVMPDRVALLISMLPGTLRRRLGRPQQST
jgi:O-antigen/teichoic acid export membrane protein